MMSHSGLIFSSKSLKRRVLCLQQTASCQNVASRMRFGSQMSCDITRTPVDLKGILEALSAGEDRNPLP
jgi:hypothetical protein